jgi:hypothetical protein
MCCGLRDSGRFGSGYLWTDLGGKGSLIEFVSSEKAGLANCGAGTASDDSSMTMTHSSATF